MSVDALVIGAGPNGLAAAIELARNGASVTVLEAGPRPGGGTWSEALTLPGFVHDACSACHPMGALSPFFTQLGLEEHGLQWAYPKASVGHPLDDGPSAMLYQDLDRTVERLGVDGRNYRRLVGPLLAKRDRLLGDALAPLGIPADPIGLTQFGLRGLWPCTTLANGLFREPQAKALLAGCAAHATQPLSNWFTGAMTTMFLLTAHWVDWPVAKGGSESISRALVQKLESLGGTVQCGVRVESMAELPPARVVLFDTDPRQVAAIAGDALPQRYRARLGRYRYGPGAFKLDWALSGPIPWKDPTLLDASTVHLGGTLEEIAAAEADAYYGRHPDKPYVLLVQQSQFDDTRAPAGKHTGYAYCHVPFGSDVDMEDAIVRQVERFAPGFRDTILATHVTTTADFAARNPNYVGGVVTGGTADIWQLFTRPVARIDPYTTPNPRVFLCSSSTPPGGGVHGMCGYHAARSALKRLQAQPVRPF